MERVKISVCECVYIHGGGFGGQTKTAWEARSLAKIIGPTKIPFGLPNLH